MKNQVLTFLVIGAFTAGMLGSCTDKCTETRVFRQINSVQIAMNMVRSGVGSEAPRPIEVVGKIYAKDNYIFINEVKRGVHIFDNTDPKNPKDVGFLRIPGNGDIAIKGDVMYADSYMDVVALDIKNPTQIREVGRVKNIYRYGLVDGLSWSVDTTRGIIFDTDGRYVTQKISTTCDDFSVGPVWGGWDRFNSFADGGLAQRSTGAPNPGGATGTGGSMARFTIYDNYLYTVDQNSLNVFGLSNPTAPVFKRKVDIGWGIETVFPYKDKLFIGSTTGMFIFSNTNPESPQPISSFTHARACDPVVADDKYAYVTLRSNSSFCTGIANQLDVIDISNIGHPKLLKTYPMTNPYGLGLTNNTLFICEGKQGLKTLDASNVMQITQQQHLKDINAIDVIPLANTLLVIGRDGLYQYNYSNPKNLQLLSKIAVKGITDLK